MAALSVGSTSVVCRARRTVSRSTKSLKVSVSLTVQAKANESARSPVVLPSVSADANTQDWNAVFRYAGAKPWSRKVLEKHLPAGCTRILFPCGGSASDAFGYRDLFPKMVVADANADLINVHRCVVNRTEELIAACGVQFNGNNNEQAYSRIRDEFRTGKGDDLTRAAQYIYLQQHNQSGISRYSVLSGYNSSFAKDEKRKGVPVAAIREFARMMAGVGFVHADMLATLAKAGKGDAVLLDPPYRPAEGQDSTHTNYTPGGFPLSSYKAMVKAVRAAARRGAVVFVHDHDTAETRGLHATCSEILPVSVLRKSGKKPVFVAEAVFIYRPVIVAQAVTTPKIEVAPVAAANDARFAGWNEQGVIEAPKIAVSYTGKANKADATLWAHPVEGQWFAGFDFAFRTGEYHSETRLPSKLDAGCETASLAVKQAAEQLLADLADRFPDLKSLVKAESVQVSAMRGWLNAQIEIAHAGGFEEKPAFIFIDLFAGIGGFHHAMKQAGGKCVLACEKDEEARKTYLANHHMTGVLFAADITRLAVADVPDHDVLCAGFPCQAYSIAGGKRGFEDQRGGLIFDLLRIIRGKLPKVLLLENVKNFCAGNDGAWHRTLRRELAGMGYAISSKVLNAAHFGTAQERERVFFVAYRRDAFADVQSFQLPVGDGKWVSVADILEPNAPAGHHDIKDMVAAPTVDPKSPFKRVGKMKGRRGQDARVYDPAGHAATLMASQQNCGLYLVKGKPRALTPRERARLQGFPDTFKPHPVKTHANKQFGNSVAVPVVAAIGHAVANQFFNQAA